MTSQRLKNIFALSIPVFMAHGLEEYFTGLYNFDSFYQSFFNPKTAFVIVVLVLLNVSLIVSYVLIQKNIWVLGLALLLCLLLIYELIHFYEAFRIGGYYPGLITALAFPVITFLLIKELVKIYKGRLLNIRS